MAAQGAAVVVGAGDALGGAIARRFAKGGLVAVPSRRKIKPLGELVAQIEADGGQAEGIPCDARDEEAVIAMFDRVEEEIGPEGPQDPDSGPFSTFGASSRRPPRPGSRGGTPRPQSGPMPRRRR